jgi:hypothetical protein
MLTTLIAQNVRFARPNIQIYDARVVDLYQWICARYRLGVKGADTKESAIELGTRSNFRTDHAGFQPKGPLRTPLLIPLDVAHHSGMISPIVPI